MALRLFDVSSPILKELNDFITGERFNSVVAGKFGIDFADCTVDGGIQKYLDGYEISPHADIRRKASTFMVNINPDPSSESMDHHTHYLRFADSRDYVRRFWEGNPTIERAWVPWSWAVTEKQQTANNSIVLFSPSNDTLHGVRADYDHFKTQRTQLYGNLWYKGGKVRGTVEWENLDLAGSLSTREASKGLRIDAQSMRRAISRTLPDRLKSAIGNLGKKDELGRRDSPAGR